jgi:dipeptide/tripeptide permease
MERKLVKLGALLMAIGILPIALYSLFGPADGNPVGLGLVMVVLVPIGFLLVGTGLLRLLLARLQQK